MKLELFSPRLSAPLLIFAVFLFLTHGNRPALATTEAADAIGTEQLQKIDMEGYAPNQTDWSEKAIAKYEKTKSGGGSPLAVLTIERLNIKAPVYFGTHRITLDRGLGMVEGTAYPDEVGNIGISGHRDGFFRPLKDIKVGDAIEMLTPTGVQEFEVSEISIVDALEVSVLDPTDTTVLTLITCYPFYYQGYAPDRYIVRAIPIGSNTNGSDVSPTPSATQGIAGGIQ